MHSASRDTFSPAPAPAPTPTPPPTPDEPLIGPRTLAAWCGISEHTVRAWIKQGPEAKRLPRMIRINGQVRFRPADVREWLAHNEIR